MNETDALVTGQSVTGISQHVVADLGWDRRSLAAAGLPAEESEPS
jgi:hypothetical protein